MNTLRAVRLLAAPLLALMILGCAKPAAQPVAMGKFATPEAGVEAFVNALRVNDRAKLREILGPEADALLHPADEVQSRKEREAFLLAYDQQHELVGTQPDSKTLEVGPSRWPLPIPIVRREDSWQFDAAGGIDELIMRRIGRNELAAIDVCYGVVAAQSEFAAKNGAYATKVMSDPGKQNGLYWETKQGENTSPAGPLLALAAAEGYSIDGKDANAKGPKPYHGYFYRALPAASKDDARKGFALIAYPAEYGVSGVMTFLVNQDGVVLQKDLGEDTATEARSLSGFAVDAAWAPADS